MVENYKKLFADARNTINEKEKDEIPELKKSWDESWVEYIKRNRIKGRLLLLLRLNPTNKCPLCKEVKLKSRQWIIVKSRDVEFVGHRVVCKSCYMKLKRRIEQ